MMEKFKIFILKWQQLNTIPSERLKLKFKTLQNPFNECLTTGNFPDNLELADVNPVFKKRYPLNNENYKAVSVLPSLFKIFKKLIQKRINGYMNSFLYPVG